MYIKNIIDNFKKYSFLLRQLVSRDFKVKYKRSVLGSRIKRLRKEKMKKIQIKYRMKERL